MKENLYWNRTWLDKAILVCKDPRTHLRMKLLANCYDDADDITDILNMAWRFGFKFHLFIPQTDVDHFSNSNISAVDRLVLPKIYDVGFSERFMTWDMGGEMQYVKWLTSAKEIVERPNAVAFISEGGILSSIAQIIDPSLIHRFVQGPSVQVSEYARGEVFKQSGQLGGPVFFVADHVSEGEKLLLLGYIREGGPEKDRTLFPTPSVFEESSLHYRGMIGEGANAIIANLLKDLDNKIFKWRTARDWKKYLRRNNFGERAPAHVPSSKDFDEVGRKMNRGFPISWQQLPIRDIQIPETFDPRAHRD
ncbi:hypothetical protein C8R47DRAFT_981978 [Mycena vitilis]|nr:hypothetical protein C8R47DRAFT_981978 [Mycena vitilis]